MRLYSILLFVLLSVYVTTEESTHDRIQKHREWLNQRNQDRKVVGLVETNDPYQKIRYFKKLIKFKNKEKAAALTSNDVTFIPRISESSSTNNLEINNNTINRNEQSSSSSSERNELFELTTGAEAINKFAYETITNNANEIVVVDEDQKKATKHKAVSENNKKQPEELTIVTSNETLIEKESNGNKIDGSEENVKTTAPSNADNETLNHIETQKFIFDHVKYNANNITIKKSWGKWSHWSGCSRSCGKGVMSQSRNCILRMYKEGKRINMTSIALNECIGFYKRFRICNDQDCPPPHEDFREQQCREFNTKSFKGLTYEWEPFLKEDAECELNCKPKNQKYFARLKEHVVDGTKCTKVAKSQVVKYEYAVCVEGKCKAVLKNGIISGSGFMNSGNVRCGNAICRPISGIFAKNPLPNGYIHVVTIPAGASNITITEMQNSINLLALKSAESKFIINGNYSVSPIGKYELADTMFEYHRYEGKNQKDSKRTDGVTEWITALGPLFEPIHLMVLSQQTNPGVKYEYLLPTILTTSDEISDTDYFSSGEDNSPLGSKLKAANFQSNSSTATNPRRRRKFSWKVVGFTACSKTCGGGTQQPIVRCTRGENTKAYQPKKCSHLQKPQVNENLMKCNSHPCPAFWKLGDWTHCHCGTHNQKTDQTREAKCVQELISGVIIQVNSGACDEKPSIVKPCNCVESYKTPILDVYKNNPPKLQNDQKANKHKVSKPTRTKKSGIWLTSDWSDSCSCGAGQQFRSIFCDRTAPNNERCDIRQTPNTYRECEAPAANDQSCLGEWFIGPWGKCEGDCFSNSSKIRTVVCVKDNSFAEESECDVKNKPESFKDCTLEEMKDCGPKWHISEWTECSKPCGGGSQKRLIKCLEVDRNEKVLRDSKNCKYAGRPQVFRYCNTQSCSENSVDDPRIDVIQNDETDPNCRDVFPNCAIVLKSKLCGYHYYNENCCQSCRSISNELY